MGAVKVALYVGVVAAMCPVALTFALASIAFGAWKEAVL